MRLLLVVQPVVAVRGYEVGEENPLGDLRAVDAVGGRDGDVGVGVDRVVLDVVAACAAELEEREVGRVGEFGG